MLCYLLFVSDEYQKKMEKDPGFVFTSVFCVLI